MLLPALQQARERGMATTCINNMKTLGTSIGQYSVDYKDWLPGYWCGGKGSSYQTSFYNSLQRAPGYSSMVLTIQRSFLISLENKTA